MRHGAPTRRSRNRNNNRGKGGNNRSQVFDSNGPDVRIRGTAHQICEKYVALAKDARSSGDHVLSESYLQHAEHYQRIILSWNEADETSRQQNEQQSHEVDGNRKEVSRARKAKQDDDLSLPASILGEEVKVASKQQSADVHAKEAVLEDA